MRRGTKKGLKDERKDVEHTKKGNIEEGKVLSWEPVGKKRGWKEQKKTLKE